MPIGFPRSWSAAWLLAVPVAIGALTSLQAWGEGGREEARLLAERNRELDARSMELRDRMEAKQAIVTALVEGRTTLGDVAERFAAMNQGLTEYLEVSRTLHPGATDEELVARNVFEYAELAVSDEPLARRVAVLARVDAELTAYLASLREEPCPFQALPPESN